MLHEARQVGKGWIETVTKEAHLDDLKQNKQFNSLNTKLINKKKTMERRVRMRCHDWITTLSINLALYAPDVFIREARPLVSGTSISSLYLFVFR